MQKILLTGGRNPMTLALARALSASGLTVYLSDSISMAFPRYSRYVKKYFVTPHASENPEAYIRSLLAIIDAYKINVLAPTNEEIFYISQFHDVFNEKCLLLCDTFDKLDMLHNKFKMTEAVSRFNLKAPETYLIKTKKDLSFLRNDQFIFKPVYSRFAHKALVARGGEVREKVDVKPGNPYVAQRLIDGSERCSFSIAAKGKVTAHVCYEHPYTMGKGSGIYNVKVNDARIEEFCRSFCAAFEFSGQIGFDYLIDKDGERFIIDCNPRTTSGIHFFDGRDNIFGAFMGTAVEPADGTAGKRSMNGLLLLSLHGIKSIFKGRSSLFLKQFTHAQEGIFNLKDPAPFFAQPATLLEFIRLSAIKKISFQEAFYYGNHWDGQWRRSRNLRQPADPQPFGDRASK